MGASQWSLHNGRLKLSVSKWARQSPRFKMGVSNCGFGFQSGRFRLCFLNWAYQYINVGVSNWALQNGLFSTWAFPMGASKWAFQSRRFRVGVSESAFQSKRVYNWRLEMGASSWRFSMGDSKRAFQKSRFKSDVPKLALQNGRV